MIRLFRVFVPTSVAALLLSETLLITTCYVLVGFLVIDAAPEVFFFDDGGFARVAAVVVVILLGMHFSGLYNDLGRRSRIALIQQLSMVVGVGFLSQAVISYVNRDWMLPRWVMIYGSALVLLTVPAWRVLYSGVVAKALGSIRVLFIGNTPVVQQIANRIRRKSELGYSVFGYLDDQPQNVPAFDGELREPVSSLAKVLEEGQPNRIVVGMRELAGKAPLEELLELRLSGLTVENSASIYEAAFGRVSIDEIEPASLLPLCQAVPTSGTLAFHMLYSAILALLILIPAIPIMLLIALWLKLTSKQPVFEGLPRSGLNGKPFNLYRFRPVRGWLTKYRLNLLPQLFNVICGDVALCGPEPQPPEFVRAISARIPYYPQRQCVRPGITGWAQIQDKTGEAADVVTTLEYDLFYVKNFSMSLDLYILLHSY